MVCAETFLPPKREAGRQGPSRRSGCIWGCLLCLILSGGALRAETFDYFADRTLVVTTVDISTISSRTARLAEVLVLVQQQTNFEFVYMAKQIPLNDKISFESDRTITLARLFYSVSNITGVVFTRQNLKVIARQKRSDDRITPGLV